MGLAREALVEGMHVWGPRGWGATEVLATKSGRGHPPEVAPPHSYWVLWARPTPNSRPLPQGSPLHCKGEGAHGGGGAHRRRQAWDFWGLVVGKDPGLTPTLHPDPAWPGHRGAPALLFPTVTPFHRTISLQQGVSFLSLNP